MRLRKQRIIVGLLIVGFLCAGSWAFWHYWQYRVPYLSAANRLAETTKEAKALGLALTPDDLRSTRGKDPRDNAAEDFRRATILISGSGLRLQGGNAVPLQNFVFSGGDSSYRATADIAIKMGEVPEKALDEAFTKPYCDFELDYSKGISVEISSVVDLRPMTSVFGAKAVLAAQEGDIDTALAYIERVNALRTQLVKDPGMRRALLTTSADAPAPVMLFVILSILGESPEVISKTRELLKRIPVEYTFESAMQADLCVGLLDIEQIGEPAPERGSNRGRRNREELIADYVPDRVLKDAYKERYIRFWINAFKGIRKHPDSTLAAASEIDKLILSYNSKSEKPDDKYTTYAFPRNYWGVASSIMRHQGMLTLASGYLDLIEFKNKNGRFPNDGELELPIDPYTGQALRYERRGSEFILWCQTGTNPSTGGPAAPLGIEYPGLSPMNFGSRGSGFNRRPNSG
ncbi:MAG: hypothetical protein KF784_13235 [Fimbriimonadaceae bacterium]|nr:hypothetical protein [Fimbriimonadaceae bacterium]